MSARVDPRVPAGRGERKAAVMVWAPPVTMVEHEHASQLDTTAAKQAADKEECKEPSASGKYLTQTSSHGNEGGTAVVHKSPVSSKLQQMADSHDYQSFKAMADNTSTSEWVLMPHSKEIQRWDLVMLWSLVFVAIVTPFQVGFLSSQFDVLFGVNTAIDLLFLGDIVVNFHRVFFDHKHGRNVQDLKSIRSHYLCGWFGLDLVSIFPFELMSSLMFPESGRSSQVRAVRVVKLTRLIKLCRMHKTTRAITRIQVSLEWSYASFQLLLYSVIVLIVIHWLACLWGLVGKPLVETCEAELCVGQLTGEPTWLTLSMRPESMEGYNADHTDLPFATPNDSAWWTPVEMYLASFEFAMCIMVLSYSENIIPSNAVERAVALFCMLVGGGVYAYMIGTICGLLASSDPVASEFQAMSDLLNRYLREKMIVGDQKTRLQEFFNSTYCRDVLHMRHYAGVLQTLSPVGQTELAMRVHESRMSQIGIFNVDDQKERARFLAKISIALEPAAFPPLEIIYEGGDSALRIYFLERGLVGAKNDSDDHGSLKKSGSNFGADAIVPNARHRYGATTLTYVVVFSLSSVALHEVLHSGEYPETKQRMRSHIVKYHLRAFCRQIVYLAKIENLLLPDGKAISVDERTFKSKAEVTAYKKTLKKSPGLGHYVSLRSKVMQQINAKKFSRKSQHNQAQLAKVLGPKIAFRGQESQVPVPAKSVSVIAGRVSSSLASCPVGAPAGSSDVITVEMEQVQRQLAELDSKFEQRFERLENLILGISLTS